MNVASIYTQTPLRTHLRIGDRFKVASSSAEYIIAAVMAKYAAAINLTTGERMLSPCPVSNVYKLTCMEALDIVRSDNIEITHWCGE